MFIQNVSMEFVKQGFHYDAGENSMLIQIVDPAYTFPTPKKTFKETHQFEFLDIEKDEGNGMWEFRPTQEQANELVALLHRARENRMNVIVHCHAGLCRSGAVAEIGVIMGFDDTETVRLPNTLLKGLMMKTLGLSYDAEADYESQYEMVNGLILLKGK